MNEETIRVIEGRRTPEFETTLNRRQDEMQAGDVIQVTQEHIDRGQPGNCGKCMVAMAIADHYGQEADTRYLASPFEFIELGQDEPRFRVPPHVRVAMNRFDRGERVHPFEFVVGERVA